MFPQFFFLNFFLFEKSDFLRFFEIFGFLTIFDFFFRFLGCFKEFWIFFLDFWIFFLIFFGICWTFLDFWIFWIFFEIFGISFDFFGFLGFLSKLVRLLLKVTKFTTGHQKLPKMNQNSIIRSFFAGRSKKPRPKAEALCRS